MRRILWTATARDDLRELLTYVAAEDPERAIRLADQMDAAVAKLGAYPSGRPGRIPGIFELSLPKLRYVVACTISPSPTGDITIIHIIHTSRDWPPGRWPD